jgi:8-amino-7-oxononanoate synthase
MWLYRPRKGHRKPIPAYPAYLVLLALSLKQLQEELDDLKRNGLYRQLAGRVPDRVVNFSSNDYLGLAADPALLLPVNGNHPVGAGAARLIRGDFPQHNALEADVAAFKNADAALLFSSGYQANLGALTALAGPTDIIFSDALNHASIIDGCRLSRATVKVYPHLDAANLAKQLTESGEYRRRIIVTDSVFGMDGDEAPLEELASIAAKYDALFVVDEAHATGVYGHEGRGLLAATQTKADLQITTFGKALGTFGAAVSGCHTLIDYLTNRARPFIFTTALPPLICAATSQAINLLQQPEGAARLGNLKRNITQLTSGLAAMGLPSQNPHSPIQPIACASPQAALQASATLFEDGYFAQAIRPPTVPDGGSRIRLAVNANHQPQDVAGLLAMLKKNRHSFTYEPIQNA